MTVTRAGLLAASILMLAACAGLPDATPFQPVIPGFQATTCDDLATEFAAIGDPALRSVVDGPDQIADERKSVLLKRMQVLLVTAVTGQARESGVIAGCAMPDWLQHADGGFSDALRQTIGGAAYDGNPVIDYQQWLLELNDDLVTAGMGKA